MKTDQQLVDSCNHLAGQFYAAMGYQVSKGYRFDKATHPQERMCWRMAVWAFEEVNGTDIESALASVEGGKICPF